MSYIDSQIALMEKEKKIVEKSYGSMEDLPILVHSYVYDDYGCLCMYAYA